jgi:hypothetical protein
VRRPKTRIVRTPGEGPAFRCEIDMKTANAVFRPERTGPGPTRYITSEESLFWVSEPETVGAFAGMLRERFDRIRILAYLRRQDGLALSHRKQVIMQLPAAQFYGISTSPLPRYAPHFQRYFDYAGKLADVWCAAFGRENVHVAPYRPVDLAGGDIVADFAHRTGVAFDNPSPITANQSWAGNQTFLGLRLAQNAVPPALCEEILGRLRPSGFYLPSRDDARAFVNRFEESNRRLAREWRWGGGPFEFDSDFECYPERESTFSTEEMTEMLDVALPFLRETLRKPGRRDA